MLKRSREAYLTLKFSSISDRKALVDQLIDYFKKNKEEIAKDITTMMGKPIVQSREEVDYAIERTQILKDLAEDALKPEILSKTSNITKTVIREPVSQFLFIFLDRYCSNTIFL